MVRPLGTELRDPPQQIGAGVFKQRSMTGVGAVRELLHYVLQGQTKALFLALLIGRFPRQTRPFGRASGGGFVLLCLDRLAFPTPSHIADYSFS